MSIEISCSKLQLPSEPLSWGLPPPDTRSLCPLSSTEFVEPPRTKFLGTPLAVVGLLLLLLLLMMLTMMINVITDLIPTNS